MAINTSAGIGIISAALGVTLTGTVLAVGSASGEEGSQPPDSPAGSVDTAGPVDTATDLSACADLLDRYVDLGVERVTAWGWSNPHIFFDDMEMSLPSAQSGGILEGNARDAAVPAPATERVTESGGGTNVQEAGVDEPDVVKTDGSLLVRVEDEDLATYDVSGDEPELLSRIDLPGLRDTEILLAGDRVVALGHETGGYDTESTTRVLVVDLAEPEAPAVVDEAEYDTDLVTARLHGETVRLVLDRGLPDLPFVQPRRWWRGEGSALERNREIVRESTLEDWLPSLTRDGETGPLLDCADVTLPADSSSLGTVAVVGFDPATPDTWSSTGLATDAAIAYFSTDRMYLATTAYPQFWGGPCCVEGDVFEGDVALGSHDGESELFAFDLDGTDTTYVASGEVDGSIADRWAMDEYGDVLRVAVGPTGRTGDFNSIVTLREEGDDLVEVGRLDRLGVGETIESMRWFDGLAIMVTFRQIDPLYAVDLTDPAEPRLMGKLKIPGFSEYLHPLGSQRMVGIGQTGDAFMAGGAQAALFKVADLTNPRQLDVVTYGQGSSAGATTDPRQFTWLPEERTVLTVVSRGSTGFVSELTIDDGRMANRMVQVEYGAEVELVRLVPLPDGRVVLVTGDGVSFFRL
jgi:hypothetical protein